jgi:hypothetical protein
MNNMDIMRMGGNVNDRQVDLNRFASVMATDHSAGTSVKYAFIPTTRVLDILERHNWLPSNVQEKRALKQSTRGFQVWENINLSDPDRGPAFTPVFKTVGTPDANNMSAVERYESPSWRFGRGEVVRDIKRFRFVKSFKEVARFRVAVRMGSQGLSVKCTDASTARIRKALAKFPGASYRFDYEWQEAVIELPEWEG